MKTGKLIVLEGSCGTGKSTLAHYLKKSFESRGMKTIYNHGSLSFTEIGREFKKKTQSYPKIFSTSYYIADLIQLTVRFIRPWLEEGYVVIQDRYSDSIITFVNAFSKMNDINVEIEPVIDLYKELDLLETPDSIVWCYASVDLICKRLDSMDIAHQKYLETPELIQLVQNELNELYKDKVHSGEVFLFETDREENTPDLLSEYSVNFLGI